MLSSLCVRSVSSLLLLLFELKQTCQRYSPMSCFCRFILLKRRLICKTQFRCVILVHVHRKIRRKKSESKSLFKVQLSRRLRGSLNDRPVPSSMDLSIHYCHPATISNDFTSENAGPIVTKFHIKPSWHVGIKVCIT